MSNFILDTTLCVVSHCAAALRPRDGQGATPAPHYGAAERPFSACPRGAWARDVLLVLTLLALGGCNSGKTVPPWGRLSGTVSLAGKPASQVTVVFENREKGVCLTATTDDNGHYVMLAADCGGLYVGDYRITVMPTYHLVPHDGLAIKGPHPEANFTVPDRYQNAKTSGFNCTIHEGENLVDLEMKP